MTEFRLVDPSDISSTNPEVSDLLDLLYGSGGYYESISALVDEHGVSAQRAHTIDRAKVSPQLAVYAQRAGDNGLISVASGETASSIRDGRWSHRTLIPPKTTRLEKTHLSQGNAGRFTIQPPIRTLLAGGFEYNYYGNAAELTRFSRLYASAIQRALDDLVAITH